jgi:hypothetical protein
MHFNEAVADRRSRGLLLTDESTLASAIDKPFKAVC